MPEEDRRRLVAWIAAGVVLVLAAAWYMTRGHAAAAPAPPPLRVEGEGHRGRVVVDVAGAVHRPGVYRLSSGARVEDALDRAGGATARADLSQINRAAKLEDGRQVLVPARGPRGASAGGAPALAAGGGGAAPTPAVPVNLNTSTPDQLEQLDGVGPETARKILEYRQAHGGFGSVDELGQVPGIGPKRMAALKDKVRV